MRTDIRAGMAIDEFGHPELDARAKAIDSHYQRWVGIKSGSNKRRYLCRLCGNFQIDAESSRYPMTKHAAEAIRAHMSFHVSSKGE